MEVVINLEVHHDVLQDTKNISSITVITAITLTTFFYSLCQMTF